MIEVKVVYQAKQKRESNPTIVPAFSVESREVLVKMAKGTHSFTLEQRGVLTTNLDMTVELLYYQEIEGKPYVIAVVEGEQLDESLKPLGIATIRARFGFANRSKKGLTMIFQKLRKARRANSFTSYDRNCLVSIVVLID